MEEVFSKPWLERTNVLHYLCCGRLKMLRGRTQEGSCSYQVAVNRDVDSSEDIVPLMDQEEQDEDISTPINDLNSNVCGSEECSDV